MSTRWAVLLTLSLAFAALAGLVWAGTFDRLDSYAVRQWTPGGLPQESRIPFFGKYFGYHGHHFDASQIVRLPASVPASLLLLLLGCAILSRRGRNREALIWLGAFAVAGAVLLLCKEVVARPLVYDGRTPLVEFTSSFPSGHAARATILAALFTSVWPRLRWLFVVWVAAVVVSLQIDRIHALSDLVGGVLLGAVIVVAAGLDPGGARTPARAHAVLLPEQPLPKPTKSD